MRSTSLANAMLLLVSLTPLLALNNAQAQGRELGVGQTYNLSYIHNYNRTNATPQYCARVFNESRLFDPRCMPSNIRRRYQLLITGTGGCGTHEASAVFKRIGVILRHEGIGPDGSVSWPYAYNDEYAQTKYPWGPLQKQIRGRTSVNKLLSPRFNHVFHQVRCPLGNIGSLLTHGIESYSYIDRVLGHMSGTRTHTVPFPSATCFQNRSVVASDCKLEYAMSAYVAWNEHLERTADLRYQVEALPIKELCDLAGFDLARCDRASEMPIIRKHRRLDVFNHRKHELVTWELLQKRNRMLAGTIRNMAVKYGYGGDKYCDFDW